MPKEIKRPDNVVNNPGTMAYPTNVGAPAFTVPDVITKKQERGITATHQLTTKFNQLKEEYFRLVQLAEDTSLMYSAKCNFNPIVGNIYHLYDGKDGMFISMIGPDEWDKPHIGSYRLTSEHTWEKT